MKIAVKHFTIYRYTSEVVLGPHLFRLTPRTNARQQLLTSCLQIWPLPSGTAECLDQDGNVALSAWFAVPTSELRLESRLTMEMTQENPFDFVLPDEALKIPLLYSGPLHTALTAYSNHSHISESVRRYAGSIAAQAGWNTLSFLALLSSTMFQQFRQVIRPVGSAWSSKETLGVKEGACRDLAVLFCDCCRAMGIAARFVSGYESAAAGSDEPHMHAWAEVFIPGAGWRGYDPSRGVAVSNRHVAVASGFDPELAAPVTGAYSGSPESHMETILNVEVYDTGPGIAAST